MPMVYVLQKKPRDFEGFTAWCSKSGLLGCDAVQCCDRANVSDVNADSTFRVKWNVGILPQHYTASQTRRPRSDDISLTHMDTCQM